MSMIPLERAIFCQDCQMISEKETHDKRCFFCQSSAIIKIKPWLRMPESIRKLKLLGKIFPNMTVGEVLKLQGNEKI